MNSYKDKQPLKNKDLNRQVSNTEYSQTFGTSKSSLESFRECMDKSKINSKNNNLDLEQL